MASMNKVFIIGNLGRNPELQYSQGGKAFCRFSIATTDIFTDKTTGEKTKTTDWHNIVVFGKTAENCDKYLSRGSQVHVEGRIKTSSYEKDGQTRYKTDIIASSVLFLSRAGDKPEETGGGYTGHQPKPRYDLPQSDNFPNIPSPDDDIPF